MIKFWKYFYKKGSTSKHENEPKKYENIIKKEGVETSVSKSEIYIKYVESQRHGHTHFDVYIKEKIAIPCFQYDWEVVVSSSHNGSMLPPRHIGKFEGTIDSDYCLTRQQKMDEIIPIVKSRLKNG